MHFRINRLFCISAIMLSINTDTFHLMNLIKHRVDVLLPIYAENQFIMSFLPLLISTLIYLFAYLFFSLSILYATLIVQLRDTNDCMLVCITAWYTGENLK